MSTLAGALLHSKILWPYLGIKGLDEAEVGRWIMENIDRDNFYLSAADQPLLGELERHLRAWLGPATEGG